MKKILFVCVQNSCRSQMAEGFAKALGAGKIKAFSAGSKPSGRVNPDAVTVMAEEGIDIAAYVSKGFTDLNMKHFDTVVSMGCHDICPFVPADRHIEWAIEDPAGKDLTVFRKVRDEIKAKVVGLIQALR
jgi:arsenate reductase (thioredoxin)